MRKLGLMLVVAAIVYQPTMAADPEFLNFVIKNAHDRGFSQCDRAIRETFEHVDGTDIRVLTHGGLTEDSLRIIAVYGASGDAIYTEAEFRKLGSQCMFTLTHMLTHTKSCSAVSREQPAFKYEADTIGITFTKNAGGVDMILMPVGTQGCTQLYVREGIT